MPSLRQLENALVKAHDSGNMEYARVLAPLVVKYRKEFEEFPTPEGKDLQIDSLRVREPEPSIGEKIVGTGEAALTAATGATTGTIGMIGNTLKGIAKEILSGKFGTQESSQRVQNQAMQGMQALTYQPKTRSGQDQVEFLGGVTEGLPPVIPVAGQLAGTMQPVKQAISSSVKSIPKPKVKEQAVTIDPLSEQAIIRQSKASDLPVPIKLTEGQKTREFDQQKFEKETAKVNEAGAPLRQRFSEQNLQLQQNLDAFIDQTGAKSPDLRSIGLAVDKALNNRAAKDKDRIRVLYKEAEKSGEMEQPVVLNQLMKHIDDSAPEAVVANVLPAIRAKAIQLGAATEGQDGNLIAQPTTLKNTEILRKSINAATNNEPTNIRQASIMKGLIDDQTQDLGGRLYQKARMARSEYAKNYENIGLVKQLLNTKKGTDDRGVSLEDVLRRSILAPSTSLDNVRQIRRLLQTSGKEGAQAWKELQGGTLRHIKDQALKSVSRDESGNSILSPSQLDRVIKQLDETGKLEFVFGKKGAEQLRVINDVAKDILTSPPGAVNHSNTATAIAAMIDIMAASTTGIPAPIALGFKYISGSLKDAKLKARVKEALGE